MISTFSIEWMIVSVYAGWHRWWRRISYFLKSGTCGLIWDIKRKSKASFINNMVCNNTTISLSLQESRIKQLICFRQYNNNSPILETTKPIFLMLCANVCQTHAHMHESVRSWSVWLEYSLATHKYHSWLVPVQSSPTVNYDMTHSFVFREAYTLLAWSW